MTPVTLFLFRPLISVYHQLVSSPGRSDRTSFFSRTCRKRRVVRPDSSATLRKTRRLDDSKGTKVLCGSVLTVTFQRVGAGDTDVWSHLDHNHILQRGRSQDTSTRRQRPGRPGHRLPGLPWMAQVKGQTSRFLAFDL